MPAADERPNSLPTRFLTESIAIALYLMGALTLVGAYQEFTRNLSPIVLVFLFGMFSISPPLLIVWCVFRFQSSGKSVTSEQIKNVIPIISGIVFLLFSLILLLAPTYLDAFNRAAKLGRIYVEEHLEVINADGIGMAADTNRELSNLDVFGLTRFIEAQTALRSLSFGMIVREDGAVLVHSLYHPVISTDQLRDYIARAPNVATFVSADNDAVIYIVELFHPGNHLIIGRIVNADAVADWIRFQNYGGQGYGFGLWTIALALGLLVMTVIGLWWVATRAGREGASDDSGRGPGEL